MKISLNWLREYIPDFKYDSVQSLSEKMVSAGLDIEAIEDESKIFDKFVIGEVIEMQKHPNADKLSLCKVNTGDTVLSIVCGAPNVEAGQKVCVAKIGAVIPNGNFEIRKTKIRGELSEGMICSEKELNMSDSHEGILVLNGDAKVGEKFSDHINANNIIFEIGITPNRGDLYSHIGVAREVAAIYDKRISIPEIKITESNDLTKDLVKIKIENHDLCKRFTGRVIRNIEIKESPDWLKKRLASVGLKPKNNIVDITNFVMFETGQPLHAFDYDKIKGKKIIVKTANDGDKFITLDSKERVLNSDSLMVCDAERSIGIAGIMGGKDSEISSDTKNIFIESAYFDPVSIRKNSKKLMLQTDASQRFERGIDVNMVEYASNRATQLIHENAGGEVSKDLYDDYPVKFQKIEIGLSPEKTNKLIGIELSEDEIKKILGKIEIDFVKKAGNKMIFEIPEFRRLDILREIDLIEEIARIYGYDNIEGDTNFRISVSDTAKYGGDDFKKTKEIAAYLTGRGFNQILTNPLTEKNRLKTFQGNIVKLKNSISVEMDALRTDLAFSMLKIISNNFNNSGKDISLKLFEIGKVYSNEGDKFKEENRLILAMSGKNDSELIYGGDKEFDLFSIKGEAEMFLSKLNLENFTLFYYNDKVLDEIKTDIRLNNESIGKIFKIESSLKKEFEIESDVYIAEFYLDKIFRKILNSKKYREISKFPSVTRDLALVVDSKVTYDELKNSILNSGGSLLKSVKLFDHYEDSKLGENKKSLAFTLKFSSIERTLTDDAINDIIDKIVKDLGTKLGASLRA